MYSAGLRQSRRSAPLALADCVSDTVLDFALPARFTTSANAADWGVQERCSMLQAIFAFFALILAITSTPTDAAYAQRQRRQEPPPPPAQTHPPQAAPQP